MCKAVKHQLLQESVAHISSYTDYRKSHPNMRLLKNTKDTACIEEPVPAQLPTYAGKSAQVPAQAGHARLGSLTR